MELVQTSIIKPEGYHSLPTSTSGDRVVFTMSIHSIQDDHFIVSLGSYCYYPLNGGVHRDSEYAHFTNIALTKATVNSCFNVEQLMAKILLKSTDQRVIKANELLVKHAEKKLETFEI